MKTQILYTTAINESGKLIHIDEAGKGHRYTCPFCNKDLILRKSGKEGKGSRRPHFAHKELTSSCTPESVLHLSYKRILIEKLKIVLENKEPFRINWICQYCGTNSSGNLIEKVKHIEEEYGLSKCRPDIALLDETGKVIIVIEIVVTHLPEESALKYYKDHGIVFIRIDLTSDEDLRIVEQKAMNPSWVEYCEKASCNIYIDIIKQRKIKVINDKCGRCSAPLRNYVIEIDGLFGKTYVKDFFSDELDALKKVYKDIKVEEDETRKTKWPVCECRNCKIIRSRYKKRIF